MLVLELIFQVLNAAGVRYVVVGGIATLLHGYARLTADVDLAVDLALQEALKMIRALVGKGFRPQVPVSAEAFADPVVREEWLQEKHMRAFSLVDPTNPMRVVDLLLKPEVPFEDLFARSQEAFVGVTKVRVASLDDLITLKRHAGRPQDLVDVEQLEAIRREKEIADMVGKPASVSEAQPADWNAEDQSLLAATMAATPTQRLAWLEEALQLAYASGTLKPRRFITKEEWDAMGSTNP